MSGGKERLGGVPGLFRLLGGWRGKLAVVLGGVLAAAVVALAITGGGGTGGKVARDGKEDGEVVIAPELNLGQAYTRLEQENRALRDGLERLARRIEEMKSEMKRLSERRETRRDETKIKGLEKKIEELKRKFAEAPGEKGAIPDAPVAEADLPPTRPAEPVRILTGPAMGGEDGKSKAPPAEESAKAWLPPGAVSEAVLVTGVDAPTDEKSPPLPVLLSFPAEALGPSAWRAPVKGCLMIGEASGDEVTERVRIKVYRLSCVRPDGAALVREVVGWVVGEDGREGVPGVVLSKQGEKIAQTLVAELASGFGKALGDQEYTTTRSADTGMTTRTLTGDALRAGLYTGLGNTAGRLADWLLQRAEKLLPVVSVGAGRKVRVVFLRGADLGRESEMARSGHAWTGLD